MNFLSVIYNLVSGQKIIPNTPIYIQNIYPIYILNIYKIYVSNIHTKMISNTPHNELIENSVPPLALVVPGNNHESVSDNRNYDIIYIYLYVYKHIYMYV